MPQLQINQGPQDALLYDNTRSYFTNVGYVRTSNFQTEFRDVDPQNTATLGSTVQFIIPKAADLLGPCDLMIDFTKTELSASSTMGGTLGDKESIWAGWVESLGFAIIDRIVFSVGSHDIETITGDQLYITNELMRGNEHRFAKAQILKTGRPLVRARVQDASWMPIADKSTAYDNSSRLIAGQYDVTTGGDTADAFINYDGKKLIIPLGLFFTKHPSQYFPLAAIAGCNDIRISVKLRTLNELLVIKTSQPSSTSSVTVNAAAKAITTLPSVNIATGQCKLRCHYVHVTGPEASLLMNKEHVRLLKLWPSPQSTTATISSKAAPEVKKLFDFELPFLHPVQELIIVIRKTSEMTSSTDPTAKQNEYDQKARTKNYFAFHGGGKDPNIDSQRKTVHETAIAASNAVEAYLTVDNFKLTLNGQERHPSLASRGLDRNYLMNRLMPMLHSNTSSTFVDAAAGSYHGGLLDGSTSGASAPGDNHDDLEALGEMIDRKEIYVYPFALNPEGANPSGAVNFSKVSHAKLTIEGKAFATNDNTNVEYRCDVWGVHYNWLQIKDGRALTSFA